MRELEEKNALITRTSLGKEDHAIFTFCLSLDLADGGCIGAGLVGLDSPAKNKAGEHIGRFGTAEGMQKIMDLLDVVGASDWEKLKGQYIRVRMNPHGPVYEIGNILKDKWLVLVKEEQ